MARLRDGDFSSPIPAVKAAELAPLATELELALSRTEADLEAMAAEEARQRALLAVLREPILTATHDGRITGFNDAATALFGGPGRLSGRPIQELLPFVAPSTVDQGGEHAGRPRVWRGHFADAAGRTLDLEVSWTRLAQGKLAARDIYVVHDVSRYAEISRFREQLLQNVAHELRGPLAVLDNALELLGSDYGELSTREFDQLLGSARRTAARLHTLMEDLLSAGRIQSGRFQVSPRPTELSAIVGDALEAVQLQLDARAQRVERDLPEAPLQVLADRGYVRQALANLLTNASQYGPEGEPIRVRAEPAQGRVRVIVEVRGPGIPAEQRAGLFERFYRVRATHEEPGIGLGLAIIKGIVEAHGGSIGVDSEVGTGTRVWFTLPAAGGPEGEGVLDEDPDRGRRSRAARLAQLRAAAVGVQRASGP